MAWHESLARGAGRTVAAALTLDAVASAVALPARSASAGASAIGGWIRQILRVERDPALARVADPGARFLAAGGARLTGARHARALQAQWRAWATALVVTSVLVAWLVLLVGSAAWWASALIGALVVAAVAEMALASVLHWQLRGRHLRPAGDWLRDPGAWVPPSGEGERRGLASVLAIIASGTVLAPPVALAATGSTAGSDLASQVLNSLFPASLAGNSFTLALCQFSTLLFFLGAGLAVFQSLSVVAAAAESGKAAEDLSPTWAAIRLVVGFGFLIPSQTTGLNGANIAIVAVAGWGSGQATTMWADHVQRVTSGGSGGAAVEALGLPVPVGGMDTARRVATAEACASVVVTHVQGAGGAAAYRSDVALLPPVEGVQQGARTVWDYGTACGALAIPVAGEAGSPAGTYSAARVAALGSMVGTLRDGGLPVELAAGSVPGSGRTWPTGELAARLRPAADAYESAMRQAGADMAAAQNREAGERLVQRARSDGWMAAGAYDRYRAQVSAQAVNLASETPTWRAPDTRRGWLGGRAGYADRVAALDTRLAQQVADESRVDRLSGADLAQPGDTDSDLLGQLVGPLNKRATETMVALARPNPVDPMGTIISAGHSLVLAGQGAAVAGLGLAWASNTAPSKVLGGDGAWAWAGRWGGDAITLMLVAGSYFAYVLPMIPFVAVLLAAVGWMVFLAEALVASSVLAFLFIRIPGRQFIDSVQRPGIALVFQLAFRPMFAILGLVASSYVLPITMGATSLWFPAAFIGQQGGHLVGLQGVVVGIIMFGYLQHQVLTRTLALVTTLPDRIPRWVGQALDGAGEAGDVEGNRKTVLALVQRGAGSAASGVRTGGQGRPGPSGDAPEGAGKPGPAAGSIGPMRAS